MTGQRSNQLSYESTPQIITYSSSPFNPFLAFSPLPLYNVFMLKLVLIRHGQSLWNLENKFTGWTDVDLSPKGIAEATAAGQTLKQQNFTFDSAFTSVLLRASHTLDLVLKELDLHIPIEQAWQLNERHYGALQGLNKADTSAKYGDQQVQLWRRSASTRPPALSPDDPRHPRNDPKYQNLDPNLLPSTENLLDTVARVVPYWKSHILPHLENHEKLIIVAHGNSLRALIKHLDQLSDQDVVSLEIPTGAPLCYELDETANFSPLTHYYL